MRRIGILITLLAVMALLAACGAAAGDSDDDIADRQINVVATIGMIADVVENVGGDRVDVTSLMGPGVDPHVYTATESDVRTLEEADVVFFNGLDLEDQMGRVLEQIDQEDRPAVAVAETISQDHILEPHQDFAEEMALPSDPHVWFDVTLWMQVTETVRDTLVELDPDHADIYEANTEGYLAELDELHDYVLEQAQHVPEQQRVVITAHDAFQYFGEAYGFEMRGLVGVSTTAEAGTADVQALAEFIVEREIPAIFIETTVAPRGIEALQEAVRSRGFEVVIGGELYSDAMGDPDTPEGTYIGMVRHNIDTIVGALLGES